MVVIENNVRSGKELILATKKFTVENRAKSWYLTISTLVILAIMCTGLIVLPQWYLRLPLSIIMGFTMVRMFVIAHDYQHHTILTKSKLAEVIMYFYGMLVLAPSSIWKRSHDYHHAHNSKLHTADIGSYPIMTKQKFLASSKKVRNFYLFTRHPLTIASGYIIMFAYGMCLRSFKSSPKKHFDSLLALILHIGIGVALFVTGGWQSLVFVQTIPFVVSSAIGAYLFYAQHNFPGVIFKENIEWSYNHAALQSSSYMKMSALMHWFTANIGFHHIHHMNAKIPFYRLKETMENIPELQNPGVTSLNPLEIYRCFQLKLWDPEIQKMISLKELKESR